MHTVTTRKQHKTANKVVTLASLVMLASPLTIAFQQAQAAPLITTLFNFNGSNGSAPQAGIIADSTGNILYGTTSAGGSSNNGVVFRFTINPAAYTLLKNFGGATDGSSPQARVLLHTDGFLYGSTFEGGANNLGTTYRQSPSNPAPAGFGLLNTLSSTPTGGNPIGRLVAITTGSTTAFWGTNSTGGTSGKGTIISIPPGGAPNPPVTIRFNFNGTNGANPSQRVLLGSDGQIYGTTASGGATNQGVVYRLSGSTLTYCSFTGANGRKPLSGLVESAGFLYGTASQGGGSNQGALFRVPLNFAQGCSIGLLASFNGGATGGRPASSLLLASNGKFYGTASLGGASNNGTIYSYTLSPSSLTKVIDFNNTNGRTPESTLIQIGTNAAGPILYGTSSAGGASGYGTLFRFTF
jgi:uncharacterized repeat protein (TIGR03803 family)